MNLKVSTAEFVFEPVDGVTVTLDIIEPPPSSSQIRHWRIYGPGGNRCRLATEREVEELEAAWKITRWAF